MHVTHLTHVSSMTIRKYRYSAIHKQTWKNYLLFIVMQITTELQRVTCSFAIRMHVPRVRAYFMSVNMRKKPLFSFLHSFHPLSLYR